jgi:hypothetical protein
MVHWHPAGAHDGLNVHEHGDAPPVWTDEWSRTQFGHPVIWGGDESTPNENILRHQAYKGFHFPASSTGGTELYIRHHSMSNPHGRSAAFHSYEVYARDATGNVSFWQGWQFYGYPEFRSQRMTRRHEEPGFEGFPGRDRFFIGAPDEVDWAAFNRCEHWSGHGGLWSWDISVTICGSTGFFTYDEHLNDPMNMATWKPTGSLGATRRLQVTHYGPDNPHAGGVQLPWDHWFCAVKAPTEDRLAGAIPVWQYSEAVDGPDACPDGWLPQYVASTFSKIGVYFVIGNTQEKTFDVTGVTLPN